MDIRIYADEIILKLDRLPKRIQGAVKLKMEGILDSLRESMFSKNPGRYLDPETVQTNVEDFYGSIIGTMEGRDKGGYYTILPYKARALRFISKDGDLVFAQRVRHPFLKTVPQVERLLRESKPWIVDQLEDAVIEAL